jgi:hypothetical protein
MQPVYQIESTPPGSTQGQRRFVPGAYLATALGSSFGATSRFCRLFDHWGGGLQFYIPIVVKSALKKI